MLKEGDKIYFGRPNGEKTLAKITKVNRKTYSIETLESRGARGKKGQKWRVPFSLATKAGAGKKARRKEALWRRFPTKGRSGGGRLLSVGDTVWWGSPQGEKTKARIVKVNPKTYTVKNLESRGYGGRGGQKGAEWRVPHKLVAKSLSTLNARAKERKKRKQENVNRRELMIFQTGWREERKRRAKKTENELRQLARKMGVRFSKEREPIEDEGQAIGYRFFIGWPGDNEAYRWDGKRTPYSDNEGFQKWVGGPDYR